MEKKNLIGRKVRGFNVKDNDHFPYSIKMDKHIGETGVIEYYSAAFDALSVRFNAVDVCNYPASEIEKHLLPIDEKTSNELNGTTEKPVYYTNEQGIDVFSVADVFKITEPRLFSALKYILRCGKKDDAVQELKKAKHCLELLIDKLEKEKA